MNTTAKALEAQLARAALLELGILLLVLAVTLWLTYVVIKCAIRDGIKESGLIEAQRYRPAPPTNNTTDIPDMRAER